ncbi:PDDEXK-like family protein [Pedobacter ureilyticus]|uniref:PD-(D/E)XK nuclease family protein n=1 Tax=Pedobacter ureilyticus TaxID=1393051 RepID=A0ABW9J517_9SPHI|nr:PD-(D/E)XK nuclease family protein [Pedobacter helvus]
MNAIKQSQSFKQALNVVAHKYKLSNYHQFNLFNVMFKMHDEKNLHSRFIAFLLNPKGSHQQGTRFLELFLEIFKLPDFSLDGITIHPNEVDRSEKYNIDILLKNNKKQAIIIENKIFAHDSNKPENETDEQNKFLRYQLPRYYYKMALEPKNERHEVLAIVYLTINGKLPEDFKNFPEEVKPLIYRREHLSDIQAWLEACVALLKEDSDLKRSIQQYIQARKEFLNDIHLATELKMLSAQSLEDAYLFWEERDTNGVAQSELILKQYMHVKWHIVYEFYSLLKNEMEEELKVSVSEIDKEKITALTHRKTAKGTATALVFEYKSQIYYVCNDKKGFSIGRSIDAKTEDDFKLLFKDKNYAFLNFSNREVFDLIEEKNQKDLIAAIVKELSGFVNERQKTMRNSLRLSSEEN